MSEATCGYDRCPRPLPDVASLIRATCCMLLHAACMLYYDLMCDRRHLRPLADLDLRGHDHRLGAAFHAELLQDRRNMRLDGRLGDAELVGDLLVEQPFGQH